jgi:ribosome biogenesis protein Nip4
MAEVDPDLCTQALEFLSMFQHLRKINLHMGRVPQSWLTDGVRRPTLGCLRTLQHFMLVDNYGSDSEEFFVEWLDEQTCGTRYETLTHLGLIFMDPHSVGVTTRKLDATTALLRHNSTTLTLLAMVASRKLYVVPPSDFLYLSHQSS